LSNRETYRKKGGRIVPDVHFYVNRPPEKEGVAALEDVGDGLGRLDHVSGVEVDPTANVVAVSFEGGRAEQEEIGRAIEEAGYEISRLSVRTDYPPE